MNDHCTLTKEERKSEMEKRNTVMSPILTDDQIQSTHIDVRLDTRFVKFKTYEEPYIDLAEELKNVEFYEKEFFTETFIIHPREFVLGLTFEYISLPNNIVARLDGKSSLGRRGVVVHATAGHIDPGWRGHLVFELANLGEMPVMLYPLIKIARITFYRIKDAIPYTSKYLAQTKIMLPPPDKLA